MTIQSYQHLSTNLLTTVSVNIKQENPIIYGTNFMQCICTGIVRVRHSFLLGTLGSTSIILTSMALITFITAMMFKSHTTVIVVRTLVLLLDSSELVNSSINIHVISLKFEIQHCYFGFAACLCFHIAHALKYVASPSFSYRQQASYCLSSS